MSKHKLYLLVETNEIKIHPIELYSSNLLCRVLWHAARIVRKVGTVSDHSDLTRAVQSDQVKR